MGSENCSIIGATVQRPQETSATNQMKGKQGSTVAEDRENNVSDIVNKCAVTILYGNAKISFSARIIICRIQRLLIKFLHFIRLHARKHSIINLLKHTAQYFF